MSAFYTGYRLNGYLGWWGRLRAALGEFLPAALGSVINAPDINPIACEDPRAVLKPGLPTNEEFDTPLAMDWRPPKSDNVFTA